MKRLLLTGLVSLKAAKRLQSGLSSRPAGRREAARPSETVGSDAAGAALERPVRLRYGPSATTHSAIAKGDME